MLSKFERRFQYSAVWKRFDVIEGNELAIHEFLKASKQDKYSKPPVKAAEQRLAIIARV